jgi:hypothetical protein
MDDLAADRKKPAWTDIQAGPTARVFPCSCALSSANGRKTQGGDTCRVLGSARHVPREEIAVHVLTELWEKSQANPTYCEPIPAYAGRARMSNHIDHVLTPSESSASIHLDMPRRISRHATVAGTGRDGPHRANPM